MKSKVIYLDNNATTPCDPRVIEAMSPYWCDDFGNSVSQLHAYGWRAEAAIERARSSVANLIGCMSKEITFTSGATEANNWVLFGLAHKLKKPNEKIHFITTTIEHSSIMNGMKAVNQFADVEIDFAKVDSQGLLDLNHLQSLIKPHTKLISVIHINNEVGSIQNLKAISKICREKEIYFHTDATQSVGKYKVDVNDLGIDLLSCSSHKFYGPKGIGFLYIRSKDPHVEIEPLMFGGGHERGLRSGTLNTPAIVGLGKAAEIAAVELEKDYKHIENLKLQLWKNLSENISQMKLNGPAIGEQRAYNNLNICFAPIKTESVLLKLQMIAFSPGSACQSENMSISHVLKGIGLSDLEAQGSLRLSLGRFTTAEDIHKASDILISAYKSL